MKHSLLQNRIFACVAAVFCTLLWGTAFPFIKLGYEAFGIVDSGIGAKLLFAGLRFTLAGILVFAFSCVKERQIARIDKSELSPILSLGAVQTFAQYLFTYIGIGFTSGTNTSVITACAAFLTVLAAAFFFQSDRLTVLKLVGCASGFAGVLLINNGGGISADTLFGDAMIFLSTVFAASGNILSKKIAKKCDPVKITAYQLLFGGVLLLIAGLVCGGNLRLTRLDGLLILLWLALVSSAAFTLWTALLKYHPASKISVFNLLVPIFGTILSGILLGEMIFRLETLLSLALISTGIIMVNMAKDGKRK